MAISFELSPFSMLKISPSFKDEFPGRKICQNKKQKTKNKKQKLKIVDLLVICLLSIIY